MHFWKKNVVFLFKFIKIFHKGLIDNDLEAQTGTRTNAELYHWLVYVSSGLKVLRAAVSKKTLRDFNIRETSSVGPGIISLFQWKYYGIKTMVS